MDNIVPLQVRTQHFLIVKYEVSNAPQKELKSQDQGIEESQTREKSAQFPFSLSQSKAIESCPKSWATDGRIAQHMLCKVFQETPISWHLNTSQQRKCADNLYIQYVLMCVHAQHMHTHTHTLLSELHQWNLAHEPCFSFLWFPYS